MAEQLVSLWEAWKANELGVLMEILLAHLLVPH